MRCAAMSILYILYYVMGRKSIQEFVVSQMGDLGRLGFLCKKSLEKIPCFVNGSKTLESLGNHDDRSKFYSKPDLLCSSSAFTQCFHGDQCFYFTMVSYGDLIVICLWSLHVIFSVQWFLHVMYSQQMHRNDMFVFPSGYRPILLDACWPHYSVICWSIRHLDTPLPRSE